MDEESMQLFEECHRQAGTGGLREQNGVFWAPAGGCPHHARSRAINSKIMRDN